MLKLLKNMRRREALMALLCLVFVVVQVYFDLRLPDYMTELTTLIKTSGGTSDILSVGLKMLGCTAASALLAVICGYLSPQRRPPASASPSGRSCSTTSWTSAARKCRISPCRA